MLNVQNKKSIFQVSRIVRILEQKGEKGASIEEIDLLIPFMETISRRTLQRRLEEMQPDLIFSAGAARATRYFSNTVDKTAIEDINTVTDRETPARRRMPGRGNEHPADKSYKVPALQNGWTNYGGENAAAGYFKDNNGIVYLRGSVKNDISAPGTTIFILPEGYRPSTSGRLMFPVAGDNQFSRIDIRANGEVIIMTGPASFLSLDGIHFLAD